MIVYNGATGGLGRYLMGAARRHGQYPRALASRLEDRAGLVDELNRLVASGPMTYIHLAAMVSVAACQADPRTAHRVNVTLARRATEAVIDWAQRRGFPLRVIYVSSGHVYAAPHIGARVSEIDATSPRSVYSRTKLEAERELSGLCRDRHVPLLVGRVFGLVSPKQSPGYLLPGLIRRVSSGDLDAIPGLDFVRDYLDARDVCESLLRLVDIPWEGSPVILNICSGMPTRIRDMLRLVIEAMGPSNATDLVHSVVAAPGRADDIPWLVGDPTRFVSLTGFPTQSISLEATVADAVAVAAREPA